MSTIIKASGPIRLIDGASFNFDDMAEKGNQYLDQIRQHAARIIAEAEQKAVEIRTRAEQDGQRAALAAVERIMDEKVAKQMASLLPALHEAVAKIDAARAVWLDHWEKAAVHTAGAIAGRLARREAIRCPEITLALVREALDLAAGSPQVKLHMHPDDHAALGQQAERLCSELHRLGSVKLVADPEVTRGGCQVHTRFGMIDQQFEAQVARIEQELA